VPRWVGPGDFDVYTWSSFSVHGYPLYLSIEKHFKDPSFLDLLSEGEEVLFKLGAEKKRKEKEYLRVFL